MMQMNMNGFTSLVFLLYPLCEIQKLNLDQLLSDYFDVSAIGSIEKDSIELSEVDVVDNLKVNNKRKFSFGAKKSSLASAVLIQPEEVKIIIVSKSSEASVLPATCVKRNSFLSARKRPDQKTEMVAKFERIELQNKNHSNQLTNSNRQHITSGGNKMSTSVSETPSHHSRGRKVLRPNIIPDTPDQLSQATR
jgi:hypothetical protein